MDRDKQIAEAEELLASGKPAVGFAKGLYFGHHLGEKLAPYPDTHADAETNRAVDEVRKFAHEQIDPERIDREADIPREVIDGLGRLGVLGMAVPPEFGGRGFSQSAYCRIMEVIGGHCAGTAVFVNAHHSIGVRALVLFGTAEQQAKWLPKMTTGEHLGAFALTEPEAGSDAANVQTMATPTEDGSGFKLNGEKRYITNAAIAQVLTVMARTPVEGSSDTKVTAFLVTPDMPGFEITEARMPKCGIRGTATGRLRFNDMFVPKENVLGQIGKGLKIALTVLDFGRTTFGASCTGAAKFCVEHAISHANSRKQFGHTLGTFELVKEKIAFMGAATYAMEACTYQTAALIDSGEDDYMLETAMLKVFSTDALWTIVNDTIQIYGGKAYFNDEPFERMMRDARINMIGEGANDVLRGFVALVGLRDVGLHFQGVLDAMRSPLKNFGKISSFTGSWLGSKLQDPWVATRSSQLSADAERLGKLIGKFGRQVEKVLRTYREGFEQAVFLEGKLQYVMGRIADAAIELYVASCVLNRLEFSMTHLNDQADQRQRELRLGRYWLSLTERRVQGALAEIWNNEDEATTAVADQLMGR